LQAHVQNSLGLDLGKFVRLHQAVFGLLRILRLADEGDHFIQVVEGDLQSLQDMRAGLGLPELVSRPARHHLFAVLQEKLENLLDVHRPRLPADDGQHDDAEGRLHGRVLVKLVQNHARDRALLELHDDPHSVLVGLIPDVAYAFDLSVTDELGDLFDQPRLVHLEGDFRNDDVLLVPLGDGLDRRLGAHLDDALARRVGVLDPAASVDEPSGGKIRPGNDLHDVRNRQVGLLDQGDERVADLPQVVGRELGRHADGDAVGTVDQEIRDLGRQDHRLLGRPVEVRDEVDRLLVDVRQKLLRELHQTGLGVTVGRGRVPVDRPEVPLAVNERVAEVPILGHADQGVVDGQVAVGMVLFQNLPDNAGAF
jgi:hypothetical protein